ncbi:hypothetical protein ACNTMW_29150 [Planosporangium sp. 12N6]|uniref:hypothetical protein n=1 Tax=Planosporangium spinosum TaxID=3402278 RepID=UPI003CE91344
MATRRIALAGALTVAMAGTAVLGFPGAALAGWDASVGNSGGYGYFYSNGDRWSACDRVADGYRVVVWADWKGRDGTSYSDTAVDADGANGNCHVNNAHNMPEGAKVLITLCLQDGAKGVPFDCKQTEGTA